MSEISVVESFGVDDITSLRNVFADGGENVSVHHLIDCLGKAASSRYFKMLYMIECDNPKRIIGFVGVKCSPPKPELLKMLMDYELYFEVTYIYLCPAFRRKNLSSRFIPKIVDFLHHVFDLEARNIIGLSKRFVVKSGQAFTGGESELSAKAFVKHLENDLMPWFEGIGQERLEAFAYGKPFERITSDCFERVT